MTITYDSAARRFPLRDGWILSGQSGERLRASVPGSVLTELVRQKKLPHPFWRSEEKNPKLLEALRQDWTYSCTFPLPLELQGCRGEVWLCFDGIDTLAEITLNGQALGSTDNMHRQWRFPVSQLLYMEENSLSVRLTSPGRYAAERFEAGEVRYVNTGTMPGSNYLRKAHYMFGWDWGPQLPDMGLWREVYLEVRPEASLEDVYLVQRHDLWDVTVEIQARVQEAAAGGLPENAVLTVELTSPQGDTVRAAQPARLGENRTSLRLRNPQLWWPNGLGDQPLYTILVRLEKDETPLDIWQRRIGLRTLRVCREKDEWGQEFSFEVNGVKFFAMGADYIPQDSFPHLVTPERTRRLLEDCKAANFNVLRVWGGGYYPEDAFYEACDELGLVVWQDLMFACNIYSLDAPFIDTVFQETVGQVKRLRHHACLGLWCGNNEMEEAWVSWKEVSCHGEALGKDYRRLFEQLLPGILAKYDPQTLYWPSSPSSAGGFERPNDPNRGDVHYWEVWHGGKPFEEYRNHFFRFCSEFGFQSFPCRKTMETFTLPRERNVFSPVLESHQKNPEANGKILSYLSRYYRYPNSYDSLAYVSQLMQARAMKYGVEHWRRNRGRCMGAIYWQLNDCWPGASWSSIDWYGRWKALHYAAKRFFAPFTASILEQDGTISVYLLNETREQQEGILRLFLRDSRFQIEYQTAVRVSAPPLSSTAVFQRDFSELLPGREDSLFFGFQLLADNREIAADCCLFVPDKAFLLENPGLRWEVGEEREGFSVTVWAEKFARGVELSLSGMDGVFSDNYFDLCDSRPRKVLLPFAAISLQLGSLSDGPESRGVCPGEVSLQQMKKALRVRSLYDSFDHN